MLFNREPIIDLAKLSTNAISISQYLHEQSMAYKSRCLVVLDPFLSPINDRIINYFANLNQLYQIKIMHPSILVNKRPFLLELHLTDIFQQQALSYIVNNALTQLSPKYLSSGHGLQYCAWLFTQAPAQQIADDLAKLVLQKHHHHKTLLLRFYDPTIFSQVMYILPVSQQKRLYGQIESWATLSRNGKLNVNQNPAQPMPVLFGQLGITDEQLKQLHCIGINNQIIQTQQIINPSNQLDDIESLIRIMPSLQRLQNKNIYDEQLMIEWGRLAWKFSADFDLHPRVQNKIHKLTKSHQYYAVLNELQSLNSRDWQDLERGI